jgi:hypothetical protein
MRIRQNKLGLEPNLFLGVLLRFIVAGVIKKDAVELSLKSYKTTEIAEELGVSPNVLYRRTCRYRA